MYAEAADRVAAHEVPDDMDLDASREEILRYATLGTVLFEPLLLALRRTARVARTRNMLKARRGPRKR